jgi:hypothetical protein
MKKYILFNVILVLLAYVFVEKDALEKLKKNRGNHFLFSENILKNVKEIRFSTFKIINKNMWVLEKEKFNKLVDQNAVKNFFLQLQNLKIQRSIPGKVSFNPRCSVNIGGSNLEIGDKVAFNENFYVRLDEEVFIVRDITPQTRPLPKEIYRLNPYKHGRLLRFCLTTKVAILDKFIFQKNKLKTIRFDFLTSSPFIVDFNRLSGHPKPLNEHGFDRDVIDIFKKKLVKTEVEALFIARPFFDGEKLGIISINEKLNLEVFINKGKTFLYISTFSLWAKLKNRDLVNVYYQDFWKTSLVQKSKSQKICIQEINNSKMCFQFKNGIIKNTSSSDVEYSSLYILLESLSKNSLVLKNISDYQKVSFKYDKILEINDKKYLLKSKNRIISVVDFNSNYQYEFLKLHLENIAYGKN